MVQVEWANISPRVCWPDCSSTATSRFLEGHFFAVHLLVRPRQCRCPLCATFFFYHRPRGTKFDIASSQRAFHYPRETYLQDLKTLHLIFFCRLKCQPQERLRRSPGATCLTPSSQTYQLHLQPLQPTRKDHPILRQRLKSLLDHLPLPMGGSRLGQQSWGTYEIAAEDSFSLKRCWECSSWLVLFSTFGYINACKFFFCPATRCLVLTTLQSASIRTITLSTSYKTRMQVISRGLVLSKCSACSSSASVSIADCHFDA